MGNIIANNSLRVRIKETIDASGIIDGHAHHNSGACCPIPLIYAAAEENTFRVYPTSVYGTRTREWMEWFMAHLGGYKDGIEIQKRHTLDLGNDLAKVNKDTFANISSSRDFADEYAVKNIDTQIATLVFIATMDMERAHIAGYDGQTIYIEEQNKTFYCKRSSGEKPESEEKKVDLSHEIIENEFDKSKELKLNKWKRQYKETISAAISNPLHLLPLYFYDPRRFNRPSGIEMPQSMDYGSWDEIFINNQIATSYKTGIWAGVKMYPSLGHKPFDELCEYLPDFYNHCAKENIPILTHCSPGGMITHDAQYYMEFDIEFGRLSERRQIALHKQREKVMRLTGKPASKALGYPEEWGEITDKYHRFPFDYFYKYYVHPEAWRPVLENFPEMHLCLAHFGGEEWRRGPISQWNNRPPSEWLKSVIDLTKTYDNVYTDISCFNLNNSLFNDNGEGKKVRDTFTIMLRWIRDNDEYKHLKNKVVFGTDWYLTHLTRKDDGAEYGNYCRNFKKLIDLVDPTFWVRFTLINPWTFYSMSKEKITNIKEDLKTAGADKKALNEQYEKMFELDDEVSQIKKQLLKMDSDYTKK